MKKQSPLRNRVKELRARLGIRQADLAREVGITRQTIIAIEKGRLNPSILICLKISRLLREPVDYVFYLAAGWDGESSEMTEEVLQPTSNTRVRVASKVKRKPVPPQGSEVVYEADPAEADKPEAEVPDRYAFDRDADAVAEPEDETVPASNEAEPEPVAAAPESESVAAASEPAVSPDSKDKPGGESEKQGQAIWDFF